MVLSLHRPEESSTSVQSSPAGSWTVRSSTTEDCLYRDQEWAEEHVSDIRLLTTVFLASIQVSSFTDRNNRGFGQEAVQRSTGFALTIGKNALRGT